jgi:C-terminal processing protease CtpA/Prc
LYRKSNAVRDLLTVNGDSSAKSATQQPPGSRLCVIKSPAGGGGYGFSMQARSADGKAGHFIGKVDSGSAAEVAGLLQGDQIIEVNDQSVSNATHKEVVDKIKSVPNVVRLLVIDGVADKPAGNTTKLVPSGVS